MFSETKTTKKNRSKMFIMLCISNQIDYDRTRNHAQNINFSVEMKKGIVYCILKSNNSQTYGHINVTAKQTLNGDFIIKTDTGAYAKLDAIYSYDTSFCFYRLSFNIWLAFIFIYLLFDSEVENEEERKKKIILLTTLSHAFPNQNWLKIHAKQTRRLSYVAQTNATEEWKRKDKYQNLVSNFWIHDDFLMKWTVIGHELFAMRISQTQFWMRICTEQLNNKEKNPITKIFHHDFICFVI